MAPSEWYLSNPLFAVLYEAAATHREEYNSVSLWSHILTRAFDVGRSSFLLDHESPPDRLNPNEDKTKQRVDMIVRQARSVGQTVKLTTLIIIECKSIKGSINVAEKDAFDKARTCLEFEDNSHIFVMTTKGPQFAAWKYSRPINNTGWGEPDLHQSLTFGYVDVGGEDGHQFDRFIATVHDDPPVKVAPILKSH